MTDVDPSDPSRVIVHLATALRRLKIERARALNLWIKDVPKLSWWLHKAMNMIKNGNITLSLDLDGTIVELNINWRRVKHALIQHGFLREWDHVMEGLHKLRSKDQKNYTQASRLIEEIEIKAAEDLHPNRTIRKIKEILERLNEAMIKPCLVTKQSRKATELILERLNLENILNTVITREDEISRRRQLELCLKKTGSKSLLHIGDTLTDIVATYKIGGLPSAKQTEDTD